MKTNKSYTKRLKITKTGKLLARKGGQDHFNAKKRRTKQLEGKRLTEMTIKNKAKSHFLPFSR